MTTFTTVTLSSLQLTLRMMWWLWMQMWTITKRVCMNWRNYLDSWMKKDTLSFTSARVRKLQKYLILSCWNLYPCWEWIRLSIKSCSNTWVLKGSRYHPLSKMHIYQKLSVRKEETNWLQFDHWLQTNVKTSSCY